MSLPAPIRLMRLEKPIGWVLLFIPCAWGVSLAATTQKAFPSIWLLLTFLSGAIIMRSAGCVWNDITDRKIDAQVERTRTRPLASGEMSLGQAYLWLAGLLTAGLGILLTLNKTSILLGCASLILIIIYPFMKRITWWPQAFLGLAFSWGALMGWTAQQGSLDTPAIMLYLGSIFWVIGYDTIYAHQDREDDALIGVHSTARLFGKENTKIMLTLCYLLCILGLGAAGIMLKTSIGFIIGLLLFAAHLALQIYRLDVDNPALCLSLFKSNGWAGAIYCVALNI